MFNSLTHQRGKVGDLLCKFVSMNSMSGFSLLVSVCTMTLLAVQRYHALLKPMNTQLRLKKGSVFPPPPVSLSSWKLFAVSLFIVLISIPTSGYFHTRGLKKMHIRLNKIQ